jgi:hypothetical protein
LTTRSSFGPSAPPCELSDIVWSSKVCSPVLPTVCYVSVFKAYFYKAS